MNYLLAVDFDRTIIEDNSDLSVINLAPNQTIPSDIQKLYKDTGWTEYMRQIFKYLHQNNVKPQQYVDLMQGLQLVDGMDLLLSTVGNIDKFDVIVISDANSVFIEEILKKHHLLQNIDEIFTNSAHFDEDGLLNIQEYHLQDYCDLSSKNLCKGHILTSYIAERQRNYDVVFYAGDGQNDFCPMMKLRPQDVALPRADKQIMKVIDDNKARIPEPLLLQANCVPWANGYDILNIIKQFVPNLSS